MPDNWHIVSEVMPKRSKSDYWAYHKAKILKEGDTVKEYEATIYCNMRDGGNKKVVNEVIHILEDIFRYTMESNVKDMIAELKEFIKYVEPRDIIDDETKLQSQPA
jgi:hypothetical protein